MTFVYFLKEKSEMLYHSKEYKLMEKRQTCKCYKCYEVIMVVNKPPMLLISFAKKMEL